MNDLLSALSHFPISNMFVLVGILLWVLAITGSVAGKITVEPAKQKTAALVGTAFIGVGLLLMFVPGPANQGEPEATAKTAQTTGTPTPKQTTDLPPAQTTVKKADLPPLPKSDQSRTRPNPSVNCTDTGTPDEIEICGNTSLISLDWELHDVYQAALSRLDENRKAKLAKEESAWVKKRGECQRDEHCLTTAYKSRIEQLQSVQ